MSMTVETGRPARPYATPITRHFSASKLIADAVNTSSVRNKAPSHPSPVRPQSPKYAYSPVRQAHVVLPQNCNKSSNNVLSQQALDKLRNFLLRSPSAIAKLRVADIVGTTTQEGIQQRPAVRKGRIAVSANKAEWPLCNLIDCFPFEKCEIVATIVKKNIIKSYTRQNTGTVGGQDESGVKREIIEKIYYEVDDESGIISCKVNPQKLYPQKKKPLAREASSSSTEGSVDRQPPRPTSDPRLWIYRYEKPPEPVRLPSTSTEPFIPILREGTVARIIGKIVLNAKKESIIDVISITLVPKEERYAEWHHAISCKKVREQLYKSREAVRELLDLDGHMGHLYKSAMPDSQSMSLAEMSRSSISIANGSTLANISHADSSYSLSYMNTSSQDGVSSATDSARRVKKKLPSLTRLAEDKTQITKQLFLLYVHHHFQSSTTTRDILPGSLGARSASKSRVKPITLSALKADKRLGWLALMCARNESMEALAQAEKSISTLKASQTNSAANSIISSSPVRQYESAKKRKRSDGQDVKQHINNDFVDKRKASLFTWAIRKLYEEGTIAIDTVQPAEDDLHATPKASAYKRCSCSIGHDKDPNTPLLSYRKCACQSMSMNPEEAYSLITTERLVEPVTNIIRRLENSSNVHNNPFKDKDTLTERVWSALKQDGLWSHVRRDLVGDTLAVL